MKKNDGLIIACIWLALFSFTWVTFLSTPHYPQAPQMPVNRFTGSSGFSQTVANAQAFCMAFVWAERENPKAWVVGPDWIYTQCLHAKRAWI